MSDLGAILLILGGIVLIVLVRMMIAKKRGR